MDSKQFNNTSFLDLETKKYKYNNEDTSLYSNCVGIENYKDIIHKIISQVAYKQKPGYHSTPFEKMAAKALLSEGDKVSDITNHLIEAYIKEIGGFELGDNQKDRYFAILLNFQTICAFINSASQHFMSTKGILLEVAGFYKLFDLCIEYYVANKDKWNKQKVNHCLGRFVLIFTNYTNYAATYSDVKYHNKYLKTIYSVFDSNRRCILLTSMSLKAYYSESSEYQQLAEYELAKLIESLDEEINGEELVGALRLSNMLYKNTDHICHLFYENYSVLKSNCTQLQLSDIYRLMSENPSYYDFSMGCMKDMLLSTKTHKPVAYRTYLFYIQNLVQCGNIVAAEQEFDLLVHKFPCSSTSSAIAYITLLDRLGLLNKRKDLFVKLYKEYILDKLITNRLNIAIVMPVILMQARIKLLSDDESLNIIYKNHLAIQNHTKTAQDKLVVINPLGDLNVKYSPIHIYDKLINYKNIPIINLSSEHYPFFSERFCHFDQDIPILNVKNSAVVNQEKHWNELYCEWEVDFSKKIIRCNNIDVYQGFFETISRGMKAYTFDWDCAFALWNFHLYKRRMDRNAYIYDVILKKFPEKSIIFIMNMHHYAPWSYFYQRSRQLNNPNRESVVQVTAMYSNYAEVQDKYTSVTALNLTKNNKSRAAFFGGSAHFKNWAKSEIHKLEDFFIDKNAEALNIKANTIMLKEAKAATTTLFNEIQKAKQQGKVVACILGKRLCDLCIPEMRGVFPDMKVWALATNNFVLQSSEVFLIVKPHPCEIKYEISQVEMESFLDWFSDDPNIYKLGHNECSLEALIPDVDCFLLWNGTSVLPLALHKANIVVCDDWANNDYPIGLNQPLNAEAYFQCIMQAKLWDKNSDETRQSAKLAFLFDNYLKSTEFSVNNIGVERSATNVDWNLPRIDFSILENELINQNEDYEKVISRVLE